MRLIRLLAALLVLAAPARAQDHPVDRAAQFVRDGDYAGARVLLERWWQDTDGGLDGTTPERRARALHLRARLAPDLAAAENDYLALVLGYPTAPEAADALLRLGQGLLAAGEPTRAIAYLERLAADYPNSVHRAAGLLWLARARRALDREDEACAAVHAGLDVPDVDAALGALLRAEADVACGPAMTGPLPPPVAADARYTVQAGAFRNPDGAERIAARLRDAGFDPRLVFVPRNSLLRVRIGHFTTAAEATLLAERLRSGGFEAVVAGDALEERPRR